MDDLPSEYDLVVIGTGFSESVIAAAGARVGKSVLHIDENDFYGSYWASFNLESFSAHLERCKNADKLTCRLRSPEQQWYEFNDEQPEIKEWNKEKIQKENRRFNIDLIPKVRINYSL